MSSLVFSWRMTRTKFLIWAPRVLNHLSDSSFLKRPKDRQEALPAYTLQVWGAVALQSCSTEIEAPPTPTLSLDWPVVSLEGKKISSSYQQFLKAWAGSPFAHFLPWTPQGPCHRPSAMAQGSTLLSLRPKRSFKKVLEKIVCQMSVWYKLLW